MKRRSPIFRNSDEGLRAIEREVAAAGDVNAITCLIVARLRAGVVTPDSARWAEFFSRRIPVPDQSRDAEFNWNPVAWWIEHADETAARIDQQAVVLPAQQVDYGPDPRVVIPVFEELVQSGRFSRHPRTVALNAALGGGVISGGPWNASYWSTEREGVRLNLPSDSPSTELHEWALRRGIGLSDTGGDLNHPPLEVQGMTDPEEAARTEAEGMAILAAQNAMVDRYLKDRPDGWASAWGRPDVNHLDDAASYEIHLDDAARYEIRREAFAGTQEALQIIAWLRVHSTLNYFEVLSSFACTPLWHGDASWRPPEGAAYRPYGDVERELVSALLGGAPL